MSNFWGENRPTDYDQNSKRIYDPNKLKKLPSLKVFEVLYGSLFLDCTLYVKVKLIDIFCKA